MSFKDKMAELFGIGSRSSQARSRGSLPPQEQRRARAREASKLDEALNISLRQIDRRERSSGAKK